MLSLLLLSSVALATASHQSPLLGFASNPSTDCIPHTLYVSLPGLHSSDLPLLPNTKHGLRSRFEASADRVWSPFVSHDQDIEEHLQGFRVCAGAEEQTVVLNGLKRLRQKAARKDLLRTLDHQISEAMALLPADHLVVVSSQPNLARRSTLTKRQESIQESNIDEVEAIEAAETADVPSTSEAYDAFDDSVDDSISEGDVDPSSIGVSEPTDNLPSPFENDEILEAVEEDDSAPASSTPVVEYQDDPTTSPTASIYSNKALIARYSIVTPNLIFATLVFLLVLFPAAFMSISALGAIEAPIGLNSKMMGSVSGDKKDQ